MQRDLNDAWLRTLAPPTAGRVEIRDTVVKGLVLRMVPAKSASKRIRTKTKDGEEADKTVGVWCIRTRTKDGKQPRLKMGTYPDMGIADARKAARKMLASVTLGADPAAERKAARVARAEESRLQTVKEALDAWQADRAADAQSPWSDKHAGEVARIATRYILPKLGKRKLKQTTRADWTGIVTAKRKTAPAMAALIYRVVSSFLNHAEAQGLVDLPLLPRKGAATLAPAPKARDRVLTDQELALLWDVADREPPKLRAFVRLLILTGAREKEVADIVCREIDLATGLWTIPGERTKNQAGYTVPLNASALAELRAVWPASDDMRPGHHLLGRTRGAGFRGFSKLKERVDIAMAGEAAKAGLPAPALWRWHDLRRTVRTGLTRLGVPREHAEAAINHIGGRAGLVGTYERHDYAQEIIAALALWQGHVAGLVGQGAELVTLADRRARGAGA